jgi:hypothetical protein
MNKSEHESMIDTIIDEFNFERVHIAMTALDWQWKTTEGNGYAVPTMPKLKAMARRLLNESIKEKVVGSGGFVATYHAEDKDEIEYFQLKFVLAQEDSYDD